MSNQTIRLYARVPKLVTQVSIIELIFKDQFCIVTEFDGNNSEVSQETILREESSKYIMLEDFKIE